MLVGCLPCADEHSCETLHCCLRAFFHAFSYGTVEAGVTRQSPGGSPLARRAAVLPLHLRKWLVVLHLAAINSLGFAVAVVFPTVTLDTTLPAPGSTASPPFSRWTALVVLLVGWVAATLSMQVGGSGGWGGGLPLTYITQPSGVPAVCNSLPCHLSCLALCPAPPCLQPAAGVPAGI